MKNIDVKSLLIGTLLASTIFLGVAATSPTDKWDDNQVWEVKTDRRMKEEGKGQAGWEPFGYSSKGTDVIYRKRIK